MNIIISGGPCGGKTTTVEDLKKRGYTVVPETATDLIIRMQSKGLSAPWAERNFQRLILTEQCRRYAAISDAAAIVFHDRSPIDTLSYQENNFPETYSVVKPIALALSESFTKLVFILKNLGRCDQTDVRHESVEEAVAIEQRLINAYRQHGFEVIEIPVMSVAKRSEMILDILKKRELLKAC